MNELRFSFHGAMQLQRDVSAKNPDLVIVEWAVNHMPGKDFAESCEGVLRQLLRSLRKIAVTELFFMHEDGENAQMWQEILGRHYGLPMVSFRDAWFPELTSGRTPWDDLYADVVHPKDAGQLRASQLLFKLLQTSLDGKADSPQATDLPPPVISNAYENCVFSIYESLQPVSNTGWERSSDQKFWESSKAGDSIEFEFVGQSLFLGYDFEKEQAPEAVFAIDGGKLQPLKEDAHRRPIASNLSAGTHRIRIDTQRKGTASGILGKLKVWGVGGAEASAPQH